jgi:competence protein ComEA
MPSPVGPARLPLRRVRPGRFRLKIGLGAAVVLVLVLAAVAVLVSALAPQGSTQVAPRPRVVHTAVPEAPDAPKVSAAPGAGGGQTAFVHVVGEVQSPGVYELPAGSRLVDAIAAAGGFLPTADQADLNLAQVAQDGQQVVVTMQGAAPASGAHVAVGLAASSGSGTGTTVDLNSADATALETLDGIGPALAQRILAYRTAHGGFRSVGDLQNVTGIGPKKFAAIKASVTT